MNNPLRKSLEFSLYGRIYQIEFVPTGDLPTVDLDATELILDIGEDNGPGSFRLTDISVLDVPSTLQASVHVRS